MAKAKMRKCQWCKFKGSPTSVGRHASVQHRDKWKPSLHTQKRHRQLANKAARGEHRNGERPEVNNNRTTEPDLHVLWKTFKRTGRQLQAAVAAFTESQSAIDPVISRLMEDNRDLRRQLDRAGAVLLGGRVRNGAQETE
jgi:hypothetical protein